MTVRPVLATTGALALAAAAGIVAAPAASAATTEHTWYQSIGRASAEAVCPATTHVDAAAGWTAWTASWEHWANDGNGGWVCSRSNTWAYSGDAQSPYGCLAVNYWYAQSTWLYSDFNGKYALPVGSAKYTDRNCTERVNDAGTRSGYVQASTSNQADARCQAAFGTAVDKKTGVDVWQCRS